MTTDSLYERARERVHELNQRTDIPERGHPMSGLAFLSGHDRHELHLLKAQLCMAIGASPTAPASRAIGSAMLLGAVLMQLAPETADMSASDGLGT